MPTRVKAKLSDELNSFFCLNLFVSYINKYILVFVCVYMLFCQASCENAQKAQCKVVVIKILIWLLTFKFSFLC